MTRVCAQIGAFEPAAIQKISSCRLSPAAAAAAAAAADTASGVNDKVEAVQVDNEDSGWLGKCAGGSLSDISAVSFPMAWDIRYHCRCNYCNSGR